MDHLHIRMTVGETREISIPEHGSAGYQWDFRRDLRELTVTRIPSDAPRPNSAGSLSVGGVYQARFRIHALAEGHFEFCESRPWEPPGAEDAGARLVVSIRPAQPSQDD